MTTAAQLAALAAAQAAATSSLAEASAIVAQLEPVDAPAPPPPPPPPPPEWTHLSGENASFTLAAPGVVRFGVGDTWAEAALPAGTHECGPWSVWGDPAPGIAKTCQLRTGEEQQPPAPPPPPPPPAPPPPPPPPPPPAPPPSGSGPEIFFHPDGDDSWEGTYARPKRNPRSVNPNTVAQGTRFRFQRGGTYLFGDGSYRLRNPAASRDNPIVFTDYGDEALAMPVWQWSGSGASTGVEFGLNFTDMTAHGGYAFRNLDLRGAGVGGGFGFWLKGNVDGVVIDACEVSGFYIGLDGQGGHNSRHLDLLNSRIHGNRGMGLLGTFLDSNIDGNRFENRLAASHFVHQIYLSSGDRNVVRRNRMVFDGPADSGTLTVHGLVPTSLVIEDNDISYELGPNGEMSAEGAWLISVRPYDGPEVNGYNGLVIRNNRLKGGGNSAISVMCAPGAVIEGNTIRLDAPRFQQAVAYSNNPEDMEDLRGPGRVRGNRAYGPAGSQFAFSAPEGSDVGDNLVFLE